MCVLSPLVDAWSAETQAVFPRSCIRKHVWPSWFLLLDPGAALGDVFSCIHPSCIPWVWNILTVSVPFVDSSSRLGSHRPYPSYSLVSCLWILGIQICHAGMMNVTNTKASVHFSLEYVARWEDLKLAISLILAVLCARPAREVTQSAPSQLYGDRLIHTQ